MRNGDVISEAASVLVLEFEGGNSHYFFLMGWVSLKDTGFQFYSQKKHGGKTKKTTKKFGTKHLREICVYAFNA